MTHDLSSRLRLPALGAALAFGLSAVVRSPLFYPALAIVALLVAAHFSPQAFLAAPFAMGVLTETAHPGGFMVSESPGTGSRDTVTVTVPAATTFAPGTVLGQVGSSGKYVQFDDTLSDGGEAAAGILYGEIVNDGVAAADFQAAIVNLNAEVRAADLVWATGADDAAGLVDLRALGIKARPAQ